MQIILDGSSRVPDYIFLWTLKHMTDYRYF